MGPDCPMLRAELAVFGGAGLALGAKTGHPLRRTVQHQLIFGHRCKMQTKANESPRVDIAFHATIIIETEA